MQYKEKFSLGIVALIILTIIVNIFVVNSLWLWFLVVPVAFLGIYDMIQTKHSIKRNFPILGRIRYLLEDLRPELMQYFVETDTEGRPINRLDRSVIYQRAKEETDTTPFGTKLDVYSEGYEWMSHSIYPLNHLKTDEPRVQVGGRDCAQPYSASILNISAMSFGSLSQNAILAMNKGAKMGGFAQNTGEGGLSEYHLRNEGDIIWQIGTGYFGARDLEGNFCEAVYRANALRPQVKMIELKLSQGAKPGHGGILPAKKNTPEIARIRNIKPYVDVLSPPAHTQFEDANGLLKFVKLLRDKADGKPVGFKLCMGEVSEFEEICKEMVNTGILPDFITIDGGEGGTGAAPIEFSNYVGMPLIEGLTNAIKLLRKYNLKQDIKIIASGKIFSGFQIAKMMVLGADMCNSARAMMLAVGCIQALECNANTCPTGVATQDPSLMNGLDVNDKSVRVYQYHKKTVNAFIEILAAAGATSGKSLKKSQFYRRVDSDRVMSFEELYG